MSKCVVKLENIRKFYGSNEVIKGISLELSEGGFYILLGKNGAGKSTLMRVLMRYEPIDYGQGSIFGESLDSQRNDFNISIGYVSETLDYALPLRMRKLFSQFADLYPKWDQKFFETIMAELRIDLEKYFKELSRGQKMQVAMAAALAIRPRLLLLDEITAVLDANARSFFMGLLSKFTKGGGTVLMATNIVSEVQNFADHLILVNDGKVSLDLEIANLSERFLKIRAAANSDHPVLRNESCIEVGLNSDGTSSYVMPCETKVDTAGLILDQRGITAEEIFIYFTKARWK